MNKTRKKSQAKQKKRGKRRLLAKRRRIKLIEELKHPGD